jgi:8-hydroxy-5-deazaflavin:NADPH oxidoreductase
MTTNEVESAQDPSTTIGIVGAGNLGQALARTALRAGRKVVISNSRGPESLAPVAAALGAGVSAGTVPEAAAAGIVAIAVPWSSVPTAVSGLQWHGQTVIDATNAWDAELGGRTSSELVADLVPGARLVKAANTLWAEVLGADPHEAGGRRVIFLSGDDAPAKAVVVELFDAAGDFPIDLGDLVTGGRMQQLGRRCRHTSLRESLRSDEQTDASRPRFRRPTGTRACCLGPVDIWMQLTASQRLRSMRLPVVLQVLWYGLLPPSSRRPRCSTPQPSRLGARNQWRERCALVEGCSNEQPTG